MPPRSNTMHGSKRICYHCPKLLLLRLSIEQYNFRLFIFLRNTVFILGLLTTLIFDPYWWNLEDSLLLLFTLYWKNYLAHRVAIFAAWDMSKMGQNRAKMGSKTEKSCFFNIWGHWSTQTSLNGFWAWSLAHNVNSPYLL